MADLRSRIETLAEKTAVVTETAAEEAHAEDRAAGAELYQLTRKAVDLIGAAARTTERKLKLVK